MNATNDFRGNWARDTRELDAWHALAQAEHVLEPALPIVDAHHHLFGAATDARYFRRQEFEPALAGGHNILGTVYIEAYDSGWRTSGPPELRSLGEVETIVRASAAPVRTPHGSCQVAAAIVSNVDLMLGDAAQPVLEAHLAAADGRLRGIRNMVTHDTGAVGRFMHSAPRGRLADPAFRRGLALLHRLGLAFDAAVFSGQLGEVADLADAFPQTTIVLNHAGMPVGVADYRARRAEVLADWERGLRDLGRRPNVFLKVGGLGMPVFGFGFEGGERPAGSEVLARAWQPLVDTCLQTFGAQRCMFETNFPVDKQSAGYVELWNAFKRVSRALSMDERRALFYRSACRAYRLPQLEAAGDRVAQW